jgi:plastocyanin
MTKRAVVVSIIVIVAAAAALVLITQQRGSEGQPQRVPQEAPDILPMAQRPVNDPASVLITVDGGTFVPGRVNVRVGDTIEWKNVGTQPARIGGPEVSSPSLATGQSYKVVLTKAGTIEYRNEAAPAGRAGTLVVSPAP